jgi:hypothetical protein
VDKNPPQAGARAWQRCGHYHASAIHKNIVLAELL